MFPIHATKQTGFIGITFVYTESFRAYVMEDMIPSIIKNRLKPEDIIDFACPCPCGQTYRVATKERIEEEIAKMASERIETLN